MSRVSKRFYRLEGVDSQMFDRGFEAKRENRWVFEVSWEAANKVGGIYTVIKSKAQTSVDELGDQYCLIGPYNENSVKTEVEPLEPTGVFANAVESFRKEGINFTFGRWLIDGYPQVLLLDLASAASRLEDWRADTFSKSGIRIPFEDKESNDAILFGYLVSWFMEEFVRAARSIKQPYVVTHFHEWMTGIGLLQCRLKHLDIATVFTTHATLLGRYLCAGKVDFYNNLAEFDLDKEAGDRGIYHRYCIERAATHTAHVFTTVSEITALEAQFLLRRKAEVVTPNGLNVKRYNALHEFQNLHANSKEKIHSFVRGHFHGHYDFDLDKTLYFFIAGRYEYTNKGADLFIESLARLNHKLKVSGTDVTVVAFLIFPGETNNFNVESLRRQAVTKQLKSVCDDIQKQIGAKIFEQCLSGTIPKAETLLDNDDIVRLKRAVFSSKGNDLPPICTHNMVERVEDPVLAAFRRCQLFNNRHDKVKVVFHPEFLSSTSPLIPMDYEEFVRGCHLGVFPSYYEPWGYTPAECTLMGIPSITTDLSGFGCFINEHVADPMSYGIYIVERKAKGVDDSVNQLATYMFEFCNLNRRQRIIQRNRTERLSELLDWRSLGRYYRQARGEALLRTHPELKSHMETQLSLQLKFPRPASEPPSPSASRNASIHGSDDEDSDNECAKDYFSPHPNEC